MTANGPDLLAYHVRRLRSAPLAGLSDADLLRRFLQGGAEAGPAFEVVVRRHGPLVLNACRSALGGDQHAADDCFQAVFLVLVRKARSLRLSEPLGAWLFEVARRVCLQARATRARRARHEALAAKVESASVAVGPDDEVAAAVHAEVGRLPRALRTAVVLCDLAGLSYDEAAHRLGVTHATVRGRLARGRERLRKRMELRGLKPDGIWSAAAVVPVALAGATTEAAEVMAGRSAGAVSAGVLELVNGGLHTMAFTKIKAAGLSALTGSVLIAGALGLGAQTSQNRPAPAPAAESQVAAAETNFLFRVEPDDEDAGDAVAALVRKAQRQQDRGDGAAARKTLAQVETGLRRWASQLDGGKPAVSTPGVPLGGGFGRAAGGPAPAPPAGRPAPGAFGGGPGVPPAAAPPAGPFSGGFGGGMLAPGLAPPAAPPGPAAGQPNRRETSSDVDKRLRDLERKLDRLIKQMEQQKGSAEPNP